MPSATKSRRNAARKLLRIILKTLGDEVFFLCFRIADDLVRNSQGTKPVDWGTSGVVVDGQAPQYKSPSRHPYTRRQVSKYRYGETKDVRYADHLSSTVQFSTAREHELRNSETQTGACPSVDELESPAPALDPDSDSEGGEAVALDSLEGM